MIDNNLPTAGDLGVIAVELEKLKNSIAWWRRARWVMALILIGAVIASLFSQWAEDQILLLMVLFVFVHVMHLEARFKLLAVTTEHVVNGDLPTYIVSMPRWMKQIKEEKEEANQDDSHTAPKRAHP